VAAVLRLDGEQRCRDVRLAFTGVGPTPVRMPEAESFVGGRTSRGRPRVRLLRLRGLARLIWLRGQRLEHALGMFDHL